MFAEGSSRRSTDKWFSLADVLRADYIYIYLYKADIKLHPVRSNNLLRL